VIIIYFFVFITLGSSTNKVKESKANADKEEEVGFNEETYEAGGEDSFSVCESSPFFCQKT
jgi:hypothetical protein